MIIVALTSAAMLFLKFGIYIVGIKLCTSTIDVFATYFKHKITKG